MNEWEEAFKNLKGCIASINAEVMITPEEGWYADSLYYICYAYIRAYDEHKYWKIIREE